MHSHTHDSEAVARAASRFFALRGAVRTKLAQGQRLGSSAWLRIETLKFITDYHHPTMGDVAEYFSITAPSATSLVTGLVRDGLVVRTRDPRDRRIARLSLSRAGKAKLEKILTRGTAIFDELFAQLSVAELAQFTETLERILCAARE
ncbi:MAG: hypothetical protein B7X04_04245 [Parcubacteria group bacterium 21-54-25]|nr:MAG: hypothetical protein B7X04_04245 [Parcubacteria group bacterium 21-54-25]HQU08125.1 MarR family transcriptional regulator [Candidatus Paceibacterota bacterium]